MGLQGKQPENNQGCPGLPLHSSGEGQLSPGWKGEVILCPPGPACVTWSLLCSQAVPSSCIPPFPYGPLITQGFTHLSPLQDIVTALSRSPTSRLQMCLLLPHAPGSLLASCPLSLACSDSFILGGSFPGTVSQPFQAKSPSQSRSCAGSIRLAPKGPERVWRLAEAPSMPVESNQVHPGFRHNSETWGENSTLSGPRKETDKPWVGPPARGRPKLYLPPCHSAFPSSTRHHLGLSVCSESGPDWVLRRQRWAGAGGRGCWGWRGWYPALHSPGASGHSGVCGPGNPGGLYSPTLIYKSVCEPWF